MKTRYFVSALCLAALAAGCQKESGTAGSADGFRISVTTAAPSTRMALQQDGLSLKWETGDVIGLVPVSSAGSTFYTLVVDPATISADGCSAEFKPESGSIPDGSYNVVSSDVLKEAYALDNITLKYSQTISVTAGEKDRHTGGLCNAHLVSKPITVTDGTNAKQAVLEHQSSLLELPITVTSNETGDEVRLNSVTISSGNNDFVTARSVNKETLQADNPAGAADYVKLVFTDGPVLGLGETYKAYMSIAPTTLTSTATITVSTSAGDYTFEKAPKTFEAGYRYTIGGLDIEAKASAPIVTNESEWNAAVADASAPVSLTLGADVTLTSTATMPAQDVTVSGGSGAYTLTIDVEGVKSTPQLDAGYDVAITGSPEETEKGNDKRELTGALTLTDGAKLAVRNGYLYAKDLTLGDGSAVSGTNARLVLSGTLAVASGATASLASDFIASCATLDNANGALTVNGLLYYGTSTASAPANAVSKASAQLPYSNFDSWYQAAVSEKVVVNLSGTADFIGEEGQYSPWGSGNAGIALLGENPTSQDASHFVSGTSLKMVSKEVSKKVVILTIKKFAGGNVFTGTYDSTNSSPQGANMTFGVPYTQKPVALVGYYDYASAKLTHVNGNAASTEQAAQDDQCDIYVALAGSSYSIVTSTESSYPGGVSTTDLVNDANIYAYGRLTSATTTSGFKKFRIELTYKSDDFNPANVADILVVASSSVKGGQFTGGEGATLWLDELQLEF